MIKISVLLNVNSNIIEQKADLATIELVGPIVAGPLCDQYRKIGEYILPKTKTKEIFSKIAEMKFQELADAIVEHYKVPKVTVHAPILSERGVLVTYSRFASKDIDGVRYVREDPEKRMIFLKVVIE